MKLNQPTASLRRLSLLILGCSALSASASAQYTFSVDWHSPTVGVPDSFTATPITEGDILAPAGLAPAFGPLPAPGIVITAGFGGLGLPGYTACVGHAGGTPCIVEVDALSYGTDHLMQGQAAGLLETYLFSTDEFAIGGPPALFPSVMSEAPFGDSSTDLFVNAGPLPPGPIPPFGAPVGNIAVVDGNGMPSGSGALYPGLGLLEPNFPGFPNLGDNLDAVDYNPVAGATGFPTSGVYFSLDGGFFDVFSGVPNSGSAGANGFGPADILWTPFPGAAPIVFAPAPALGLDIAGGPMSDDIDALAIFENGTMAIEPSAFPYDWVGGASDMVLFSVRRGSAVIGMPDSIFGAPIEEGDILTTPLPSFMGGVSPFPGIFCAAENIGLSTLRSGFPISDDLNALDTLKTLDCNGNGVDDLADITSGFSTDINGNMIPDECEIIGSPNCTCPAALAPCGNFYVPGGCANSTGVGAILTPSGSGSVALDDLVLTATQLPPSVPGIFFGSTTLVGPLPFGDGLRCVGGGIVRFTTPAFSSAGGVLTAGPGLAAGFGLLPFSTWNFQCWYRNPGGPCGSGFNTSNGHTVTFTP